MICHRQDLCTQVLWAKFVSDILFFYVCLFINGIIDQVNPSRHRKGIKFMFV